MSIRIDYSMSGMKVLYQRPYGNSPEEITVDCIIYDHFLNQIIGIQGHDIDGYEIQDIAESFMIK